jgi:hypothetical protein
MVRPALALSLALMASPAVAKDVHVQYLDGQGNPTTLEPGDTVNFGIDTNPAAPDFQWFQEENPKIWAKSLKLYSPFDSVDLRIGRAGNQTYNPGDLLLSNRQNSGSAGFSSMATWLGAPIPARAGSPIAVPMGSTHSRSRSTARRTERKAERLAPA